MTSGTQRSARQRVVQFTTAAIQQCLTSVLSYTVIPHERAPPEGLGGTCLHGRCLLEGAKRSAAPPPPRLSTSRCAPQFNTIQCDTETIAGYRACAQAARACVLATIPSCVHHYPGLPGNCALFISRASRGHLTSAVPASWELNPNWVIEEPRISLAFINTLFMAASN